MPAVCLVEGSQTAPFKLPHNSDLPASSFPRQHLAVELLIAEVAGIDCNVNGDLCSVPNRTRKMVRQVM